MPRYYTNTPRKAKNQRNFDIHERVHVTSILLLFAFTEDLALVRCIEYKVIENTITLNAIEAKTGTIKKNIRESEFVNQQMFSIP